MISHPRNISPGLANTGAVAGKRKTIAQVIQHLSPGGIETMALDLATPGKSNSHTLLFSLEGEQQHSQSHWPRLKAFASQLTFLGKQPGLQPTLLLRLIKLFRQHQVDVVHTHHVGPLLYAGIAARFAGIKYRIHTEHDAWHLQSRRRRILQKLALWLAKPTRVADADLVASNMRKHLGDRSIHVIRNGVDIRRFGPGDKKAARLTFGLPDNIKLVGCAGRLEKVKGQDLLIDALGIMPEHIHLAIAGNGSQLGTLKAKTQQLRLSDRVHFLGLVEDMPRFYQALDVFCLPSRQEGYPLSSLEAQACGIPTTVTDVGGSRETLCPECGTILQPDNLITLAKVLAASCFAQSSGNPRAFVEKHGNLATVRQAYDALTQ